jgi:UPF0716 protein FxsA
VPALLFVAFVVVPLIELYFIIQVGQVIGAWWTIAILIAVSVAGAYLVKREGRAAWQRFRGALGSARVPAVEVIDGALVLIGGTLLLTPGFLTDIAGLALVVPPTRALVNRFIRSRVRGRFGLGDAPRARAPRDNAAPIDVEVIDVRRNGDG